MLLAEILFTSFFYPAGCVIENLVNQVQQINQLFFSRTLIVGESGTVVASLVEGDASDRFRQERPFYQIWQRYETATDYGNQVNRLFGVLIIGNQ